MLSNIKLRKYNARMASNPYELKIPHFKEEACRLFSAIKALWG